MIVLLHVIIACSSLGMTTYLFFLPSRWKLLSSYMLIGLTVLSGTYLLVSLRTHLLEVCSMGLLYLGVTIAGTVAAQRKLAEKTSTLHDQIDE